jgi:hypothetical protein
VLLLKCSLSFNKEGFREKVCLLFIYFFIVSNLKWACHRAHFSLLEPTKLDPTLENLQVAAANSSLCLLSWGRKTETTG